MRPSFLPLLLLPLAACSSAPPAAEVPAPAESRAAAPASLPEVRYYVIADT